MFFNLKNVFQPFLIKSIIPDSDCYLCHEKVKSYTNQSKLICHHCHARLPILQNGCPICAMPTASKPSNALNQPCGACLKKTPHYHKTVSAFHYETPINDFITSLKFNGQHYFVPLLSEYLLKAIEVKYEVDERPEVIVPVPLHSKKLRERGFNQALLIAQSLSKQHPFFWAGFVHLGDFSPLKDSGVGGNKFLFIGIGIIIFSGIFVFGKKK